MLTEAGLRIELLEAQGGDNFFPSGSATMRPRAVRALQMIASELRNQDNPYGPINRRISIVLPFTETPPIEIGPGTSGVTAAPAAGRISKS